MMGRTTFFTGGIPEPDRAFTIPTPGVSSVSLPLLASIPMLQHEGQEAVPLVSKGQTVAEGECLARAGAGTGAHVHSSIPGTVYDVREYVRPDGRSCKTILVELGGGFPVSTACMPDESWKFMDGRQILARIEDKGIVSLGLHPVPLAPLLASVNKEGIRRLVVNAVQPEPWNMSIPWLLSEKSAELDEGILIIRRIFGDPDVFFAVSAPFAHAFKTYRSHVPDMPGLHYRFLENRYPQAEDRYLFQSLFNQELPAGSSPADFGTLVLDPETIIALRDALVLGRPQIDRLVMVAGSAVRNPGLYRVRIGTPVATVLDEAGGTSSDLARLVCGGAMHGCSIEGDGIPVTRDMGMILALTEAEIQDAVRRECMRCGDCMQTCPADLEPLRLVRLWANGLGDQARQEGLADCTDCGICSWICPSRLPLGVWLRQARGHAIHTGAVAAPDI